MYVKIENFQSIEKGEFTFEPGITIIGGPNGSGKSASFRAIRALLSNPNGCSGYIRHNCDNAKVTIENLGNSITWTRIPNSVTYKNNITGEEYIKASSLDSRDIADLGFYFDNKDRIVNSPSEWEVLFPFGESDSEMFKLFEDIFNVSSSFKIISSINDDQKLIKSQISNLNLNKVHDEELYNKLSTVRNNIDKDIIDFFINYLQNNESKLIELQKDSALISENISNANIQLPYPIDERILNYLEDSSKKLNEMERELLTLKNSKNLNDLNLDFIKFNKFDIKPFCTEIIKDLNLLKITKETLIEMENELNELNQLIKINSEELSKIDICPTCKRPI